MAFLVFQDSRGRGLALHVEDFVAHVREVRLDAEREIAPLVIVGHADFPTAVADFSGILVRGVEADSERHIQFHEDAVGDLVIPVS